MFSDKRKEKEDKVILLLKRLKKKLSLKRREENGGIREYIELLEKYCSLGKAWEHRCEKCKPHYTGREIGKKCLYCSVYTDISVLLEIKIFSCVISPNDGL